MKDLQQFLAKNENMTIQVSPGVSYNLRDVINESYRLQNSMFENGEDEASGFSRIFYNMMWVIWRTIIMASDVDLKDMNSRSVNGVAARFMPLLKMAVRSHLVRTFFGKYIDKVLADMTWFGSSLTKRVDGSVETVDLRNYTTEPTIKNPQERSHVETCFWTYDQMKSYKDDWKDAWQEIEKMWEKMQKEGKSKFVLKDFWTWDDDGNKVCQRNLERDMDDPERQRRQDDDGKYLILETFKTPYKRKRESKRMAKKLGEYEPIFPYEQADFFDAPGRWLAFGCCELLKGINRHYNEYTNDKRKKDILDLKGVYVHKYTPTSNSMTQEFLANLDTGHVMQMSVDESLERLIVDTKTSEYIANVDKLYEIMRLVMGVTSQGTGEELPSATTATVSIANSKTQQTTYDYVRGRMNHFLVGLFSNGYFEDIMDELDEEELNSIIGDPSELRKLDDMYIENLIWSEVVRYKNENGLYPTEQEIEAERQRLLGEVQSTGDMRFPDIKKKLVQGANLMFEFYSDNDSFDKQGKIQNLMAMKNDPNSTLSKQALENAILELVDENPGNYQKTPEEKAAEVEMMRQQMLQKAGVMPKTPNMPVNAPVPA